MEEDERDRQRERREIESLRLEVMERQARQMEQKVCVSVCLSIGSVGLKQYPRSLLVVFSVLS